MIIDKHLTIILILTDNYYKLNNILNIIYRAVFSGKYLDKINV